MYLDLFEKLEIPSGAIPEFHTARGHSWKFIDVNKKIGSIPSSKRIFVPLVLNECELEKYAFKLLNSLKPGNDYSYMCICRDNEYGLFVRKGRNDLYSP